MKILMLIPALALTVGLAGCCMTLPSFPHASSGAAPVKPVMAVAPAPAPAVTPAAAPLPPAPEKVTIALEVKFDTSKSVVKPEYDDQLKKVSDFLKAYPESRAEIEGHTDNAGSAEANKALSQRRADAVRQALIDRFGADGARLSAAGYGSDRPIADNATVEGRAKNRRVAATFTGTKN